MKNYKVNELKKSDQKTNNFLLKLYDFNLVLNLNEICIEEILISKLNH